VAVNVRLQVLKKRGSSDNWNFFDKRDFFTRRRSSLTSAAAANV
jgi:hypothetical protein